MLRDLFSLFPAYAGVILGHTVDIGFYPAFPRIRGGDPLAGYKVERSTNFSPHMRG